MHLQETLTRIRATLTDTFSGLDAWFDKAPELGHYRPANGGWTIYEILEHIGLTNKFLLILIEKGTKKALQNAHQLDLPTALRNHVFHWDKLTEVGLHQSFPWIRPEHMEPTGDTPLETVRAQLRDQLARCLACLDQLKNGEGVLYTTTMTVNDLGKIDVYEYLYFLAQHGRRHVAQLQQNEASFAAARA